MVLRDPVLDWAMIPVVTVLFGASEEAEGVRTRNDARVTGDFTSKSALALAVPG
jgi:hypothetical protein